MVWFWTFFILFWIPLVQRLHPPSPLKLSSDLCAVIRGLRGFCADCRQWRAGRRHSAPRPPAENCDCGVDAVMLCHSDIRAVTVSGTSRNFTIKNLFRCYAKGNLCKSRCKIGTIGHDHKSYILISIGQAVWLAKLLNKSTGRGLLHELRNFEVSLTALSDIHLCSFWPLCGDDEAFMHKWFIYRYSGCLYTNWCFSQQIKHQRKFWRIFWMFVSLSI